MTPAERAYKHGILKAELRPHPGHTASGPYADPELKREFRRGYDRVKPPRPVQYTMPPRQEPTA